MYNKGIKDGEGNEFRVIEDGIVKDKCIYVAVDPFYLVDIIGFRMCPPPINLISTAAAAEPLVTLATLQQITKCGLFLHELLGLLSSRSVNQYIPIFWVLNRLFIQ